MPAPGPGGPPRPAGPPDFGVATAPNGGPALGNGHAGPSSSTAAHVNGSANGHGEWPRVPSVPFVSPLRAGATSAAAVTAPIAPGEPIPSDREPAGANPARPDLDEEPPLPDEARESAARLAAAPSVPMEARQSAELHVRFNGRAGFDQAVAAMQAFKAVIRERPGSTPVVVHLSPDALPMRLRGVAYDTELLAEVQRRLGDDLIELSLS
jgi:hypothetical protein